MNKLPGENLRTLIREKGLEGHILNAGHDLTQGKDALRVALVCDGGFDIGGAEWSYCLFLLFSASSHALNFKMFVRHPSSDLIDFMRGRGMQIAYPEAPGQFREWLPGALKEFVPDVVDHCATDSFHPALLVNEGWRLMVNRTGSDAKPLAAADVSLVQAIICKSSACIEQTPEAASKCVVVHNGVNCDDYEYACSFRRELRDELGIGADKKVIIWCGRMHDIRKRVDLLEGVIERTAREGLDWVFLVLGYIDLTPWQRTLDPGALYERWEALSSRKEVIWIQDVKPWEMPFFYACGDLFLCTSDLEGFSNTTLQADAAGMPVITTAAGGQQELVLDGESGFLVPLGDNEGIFRSLRKAMSLSAKEHSEFSKCAQSVARKFSIVRNVEERMRVYKGGIRRATLGTGSSRACEAVESSSKGVEC